MPIVNFTQVSALFRENAPDRSKLIPPGENNPNATNILFPTEQQGKEAENTKPQPAVGSVEGGAIQSLNSFFNVHKQRSSYAGYSGSSLGEVRTGFVLTSDYWRQEEINKALVLHAGPSNAQWTLPIRAQDEENKAGHARYAQARYSRHGAHGSATPVYLDFPRVSFSFQAGNIMPMPGFLNSSDVSYGLQDFYNFFELLNQPPLIPTGEKEGKHNYVWIFYTSLQFPQLTLKGYFEPEGVTWTDSAEAPTTLEWEASFLVHEMTPNLWEVSELEDAYREFMKTSIKIF